MARRNTIGWRIIKILLGVGLVSVILAFSQALLILPIRFQSRAMFFVILGLAVGFILFAAISPMMPMYVLGHEFTHWLIAKLFGRRTGRFRVGGDNGSVQVSNPNIWICLGPYFVPIYTLAWVLLWSLLHVWYKPSWFPEALFLNIGFSYAFHCVLTVKVLRSGQSDLEHYGHLFSMLLIIAVNLAVLYFVVALLSGTIAATPKCLLRAFESQLRMIRRLL